MQDPSNNTPPGIVPTSAIGWFNLVAFGLRSARDPAGRRGLFIVAAILALLGSLGLVDGSWISLPELTPLNQRLDGWDEAAAKVEAPIVAAQMPKFQITDRDGNVVSGAGQNAELWKFAKVANQGLHIPTWKQQSGDCVSMGWSNAVAYRMAFQIAREQRNEILKIPFPPYMYGISRVQIGKRNIRGAGSVGAWAAQGSQGYGVYPIDQASKDGYTYSGRLADEWGREGPPQTAIQFASKFRIRTVSQVKSWEDVRDALVHGYPVTVASNVGFNGGSYDRDGKRWLRASGRWAHQMCFVGVEDRPGREKGAYCLNSWGEDAHPRPLSDEPRGGFWVDWQTVQRMVAQGDSWAYSDFDGFQADPLADWNKFREELIESGAPAAVVAAEAPEVVTVKEVRKMYAVPISLSLLGVSCLLLVIAVSRRCGGCPKNAATLLLCLSLLGVGSTAEAGRRGQERRAARYQTYQAQYRSQFAPTAVSQACDPATCGCVDCVCPSPATSRYREVWTVRNNVASASPRSCVDCAWNALADDDQPPLSPPVPVSGWNNLSPAMSMPPPRVTASWNALAGVSPKQMRRICTGSACDLVPQ